MIELMTVMCTLPERRAGAYKLRCSCTSSSGKLLIYKKMRQFILTREITTSTRDFGSAPVNEAIKILVMLGPRGIITLSL